MIDVSKGLWSHRRKVIVGKSPNSSIVIEVLFAQVRETLGEIRSLCMTILEEEMDLEMWIVTVEALDLVREPTVESESVMICTKEGYRRLVLCIIREEILLILSYIGEIGKYDKLIYYREMTARIVTQEITMALPSDTLESEEVGIGRGDL